MSTRKANPALSFKKEIKTFHDKAKKIVAEIGIKRDALRSLVSEYEEILENCDDATREFEAALDTLSQLL